MRCNFNAMENTSETKKMRLTMKNIGR